MLICARIRYVTANDWSSRRYPGHVPARRHHAINRLKSFPRRRTRPHLRKTSGTTSPRLRGLSMPLTGAYYPKAACCNTDLALLYVTGSSQNSKPPSVRHHQSVR